METGEIWITGNPERSFFQSGSPECWINFIQDPELQHPPSDFGFEVRSTEIIDSITYNDLFDRTQENKKEEYEKGK